MSWDDSASKQYSSGLQIIHQNDAKIHLERHRVLLLKWQQPGFKGRSRFSKATRDISIRAETKSSRYPRSSQSFLVSTRGFLQSCGLTCTQQLTRGSSLLQHPLAPKLPGTGKERSPSWPTAWTQLQRSLCHWPGIHEPFGTGGVSRTRPRLCDGDEEPRTVGLSPGLTVHELCDLENHLTILCLSFPTEQERG